MCRESRDGDNPFDSNRTLQELEGAPGRVAGTPALAEAELRGRLAFEYLRTGRLDDGLAQIDPSLVRLDAEDLSAPVWGYLKEIEGIAHLQAAEERNCLQLPSRAAASCPSPGRRSTGNRVAYDGRATRSWSSSSAIRAACRRADPRRRRHTAGPRSVHTTLGSGGSFGGSSLRAEIGLGDATAIPAVELRWPSGDVQSLPTLEINRYHAVLQGESRSRPVARAPIRWKRASRPHPD